MRKIWLNQISRKDFVSNGGHRICAKRFIGGRKSYMNNVPTIVPKTIKPPEVKPRKTRTSEGKKCIPTDKDEKGDGEDKAAVTKSKDVSHEEEIPFLKEKIIDMKVQHDRKVSKLYAEAESLKRKNSNVILN